MNRIALLQAELKAKAMVRMALTGFYERFYGNQEQKYAQNPPRLIEGQRSNDGQANQSPSLNNPQ